MLHPRRMPSGVAATLAIALATIAWRGVRARGARGAP